MKRRPVIVLVSLLLGLPALAAPAGARRPAARAQDLGATSSSKTLSISVWLKMHQPDVLQQTVQAQQDATSAGFQQWSSAGAINAAHSPTAAEVAAVTSFLTSRGLRVTGVGPQ